MVLFTFRKADQYKNNWIGCIDPEILMPSKTEYQSTSTRSTTDHMGIIQTRDAV